MVDINWIEDTDANPGAEVVLEVHGHNDTMHCICVIHHSENRVAKYSDPLWKAVAVQLLIDTDGTSGNEIVAVYSSELDGGVSIIHDRPQLMKTIAFTGEHPSIQQVGNYDTILGAELCIFLANQHAYELINDRSGEHVKIDNCQRARENTHMRIAGKNALPSQHRTRWHMLIAVIFFSVIFSADGWADEIIPIRRILDNAQSLAAHLVTFKGRIETFDKAPPGPFKACYMATRYRALMTDDSGSIEAILCGKHIDDQGELRIGDIVVVRAVLEVDERDGVNRVITAIGVRMERAQ